MINTSQNELLCTQLLLRVSARILVHNLYFRNKQVKSSNSLPLTKTCSLLCNMRKLLKYREMCAWAIFFLIAEAQMCFFTTSPFKCLWMLLGMTIKLPHLQNKTQGIREWTFFFFYETKYCWMLEAYLCHR